MRFGAYETAPQRVHTATGLGLVVSLVLLSCSSRIAFRSGRFSFGHEWVGGGGKSLSFTGVLGQLNGQESHTYRNRFGKTCLFSSDIGPHRPYPASMKQRYRCNIKAALPPRPEFTQAIIQSPQTKVDLRHQLTINTITKHFGSGCAIRQFVTEGPYPEQKARKKGRHTQ